MPLPKRLALGQKRRQDRSGANVVDLDGLVEFGLGVDGGGEAAIGVHPQRGGATTSFPTAASRGRSANRVEPFDHVGDAAGVLVLVQQPAEQQRQRDDADLHDVGAAIDRGLPVNQRRSNAQLLQQRSWSYPRRSIAEPNT